MWRYSAEETHVDYPASSEDFGLKKTNLKTTNLNENEGFLSHEGPLPFGKVCGASNLSNSAGKSSVKPFVRSIF